MLQFLENVNSSMWSDRELNVLGLVNGLPMLNTSTAVVMYEQCDAAWMRVVMESSRIQHKKGGGMWAFPGSFWMTASSHWKYNIRKHSEKHKRVYSQSQLCASDVILSFYLLVIWFLSITKSWARKATNAEMTCSLLSVVLYVRSRLSVLNMICASAEPVTIAWAVSTCHQDKLLDAEQDCDPEVWQNVVATKTACASSESTDGGVTERSRVHPVAFPVSSQRFWV